MHSANSRFDEPRDLVAGPDMIGHTRRHRGGREFTERRVDPSEVVVHEVQADHRRIVLDLLREPRWSGT